MSLIRTEAGFCKADETEMRAACRSVGGTGAEVTERLSEATAVVVVVGERMAKVKPASGVQWPQKETLYASTGCFVTCWTCTRHKMGISD